jgi:hypothetical protein
MASSLARPLTQPDECERQDGLLGQDGCVGVKNAYAMLLINYFVAALAIIVSLRLLRRKSGRSIMAMMTLIFVVLHMVGAYWVPDEILFYGPFDERAFDAMLEFQVIGSLLLTGGCLIQLRDPVSSRRGFQGFKKPLMALFVFSMVFTSLPVALFMGVMFFLRWLDRRSGGLSRPPSPGSLITPVIRSPFFRIVLVGSTIMLTYDLIFLGGLNEILTILPYGFSSLSEYLTHRVGDDFMPFFWTSQLDTLKTSIVPALSLLLLSAFLYKRSWVVLVCFGAVASMIALVKLESFAKSPLAIYAIMVAVTYIAIKITKSRLEGSQKVGLWFSGGLRTIIGAAVSLMIILWMYSFSNYSSSFMDTVAQVGRRLFLTPSQSAYAWFYVFPARMSFLGFSQSNIFSSLFGVAYTQTGYLPYQVSMLATGMRFGLNANLMATGWAFYGSWGLLPTVQFVAGTLVIDRWLHAVSDPYLYWPAYASVYGSLIIAVTAPFDALAVSYGVWTVPALFCILAKLSASRAHYSRLDVPVRFETGFAPRALSRSSGN